MNFAVILVLFKHINGDEFEAPVAVYNDLQNLLADYPNAVDYDSGAEITPGCWVYSELAVND